MTTPLSNIHLELQVPNFKTAIDFYRLLGFEVVWKDERYMVMKRGSSILNFNEGSERVYEQSYFKGFPKGTKRGYAVEIVIPVKDVGGLFEKIKDKVNPLVMDSLGIDVEPDWDSLPEDLRIVGDALADAYLEFEKGLREKRYS